MSGTTYPRVPGMAQSDLRALLEAGALLVAGKPYAECDFAEQVAAQNITCIQSSEVPCLDAPDEWVTINGMPGTCCKTCGMPTESEPCEQHQAAAYARCNS